MSEQQEGLHISAFRGINVDRLDKGCLILASEREQGFVVRVVDNTNRVEARY